MLETKYIKLFQLLIGADVDGIFGKQSKACADAIIAMMAKVK